MAEAKKITGDAEQIINHKNVRAYTIHRSLLRNILAHSTITTKKKKRKKNEYPCMELANTSIYNIKIPTLLYFIYKNWPMIVCKMCYETGMRAHMCSYVCVRVCVLNQMKCEAKIRNEREYPDRIEWYIHGN